MMNGGMWGGGWMGGLRRNVDASPGSGRGCRHRNVDCQARWQVIDPSKGLHLRAGLTT